ncbi:MAG: CpaF family protein [Aggregatilineales bacterium]
MSFTSKKMQQQRKREEAQRKKAAAESSGLGSNDFLSAIGGTNDGMNLKSKPKPAKKKELPDEMPRFEIGDSPPASAAPFILGAGITKMVVEQVNPDGTWILDTGYEVPAKNRTPPKLRKLRKQLRPKLLAIPDEADTWQRDDDSKCQILIDRMKTVLKKMNISLQPNEFDLLKEGLLDDLLGFGAIQPMVDSTAYSEIMVNGPEIIFAEFKGKLTETGVVFDDEDHVYWTSQRIVRPLMRTLDRSNPMVDARLPDGSRVHLVTLPSALMGTTITIRKFPEERLTVDKLIAWGSLTEETARFFEACVVSRLNIVVSGGTGSGKTTLLNVLSSYIPEDERIITVEDSAELQLAQRHVVRLETCPPIPGEQEIGLLEIRDLVKGTLRMRPDRLVVGECRSGEALDMLQAMNTGHDGSLTTVHSNSPRDAVSRLETLCMMAGMDLPVEVIRTQIASAIHLFVQQARLKDGSRKVVQITEMQGMEGTNVTLQDIFVYTTEGHRGRGYSHEGGGTLGPSGFPPGFLGQLKQYGFNLPARIFGAGQNKFG